MKRFISIVVLFAIIISIQICLPEFAVNAEGTANPNRTPPIRPTAFPLSRPESGNMMISAGTYHIVELKIDGRVFAAGSFEGAYDDFGQCNVSEWTDIVAVAASGWQTIGLKSDGTVVAKGSNTYGQCNVSEWADIVAISAGLFHTVGLKSTVRL